MKGKRLKRAAWTLTLILVTIGLVAVARRAYVLVDPAASRGFGPAAALDAGFARHRTLTMFHILPASLFLGLAPLQLSYRIRQRHVQWHRRLGRILVILGVVVAATALVMSYTTAIGGANETAATTLFALLFLLFLMLGYRSIRKHRIAEHRAWMIRALGVALGVATTRPIVGIFFAFRRLTPHEFFGTAFWLGFTITLLAAEAWINYTRRMET